MHALRSCVLMFHNKMHARMVTTMYWVDYNFSLTIWNHHLASSFPLCLTAVLLINQTDWLLNCKLSYNFQCFDRVKCRCMGCDRKSVFNFIALHHCNNLSKTLDMVTTPDTWAARPSPMSATRGPTS